MPPDADSEVCHFLLTPKRIGQLKILIELQWKDALHGTRRLRTECVAEAQSGSDMNVIRIGLTTRLGGVEKEEPFRAIFSAPVAVEPAAPSDGIQPPIRPQPVEGDKVLGNDVFYTRRFEEPEKARGEKEAQERAEHERLGREEQSQKLAQQRRLQQEAKLAQALEEARQALKQQYPVEEVLRQAMQIDPVKSPRLESIRQSKQEQLDNERKARAEQERLEREKPAQAERERLEQERGAQAERERHNVATNEQAKAPEEKHTSGFHSRGVRFFSKLPVRSIVACSILIVALIVALILYRAYEYGDKPPNYPTGAIEMKYYAPGSWAVTEEAGGPCCDSVGNKYDLYYPTPLGAGGFKHPILTWGNGSLEKPSQVAYLLKHMASWGFVVIASEDPMTGPGQSILDAANWT